MAAINLTQKTLHWRKSYEKVKFKYIERLAKEIAKSSDGIIYGASRFSIKENGLYSDFAENDIFYQVKLFWEKNLPEWDQKPRLNELCTRVLGMKDDTQIQIFKQRFLRSAAERALNPGANVEIIPVLASITKGIGKSEFCKSITPGYTDYFYSTGSVFKDDRDHHQRRHDGNFIVEIEEGNEMFKVQSNDETKYLILQNSDKINHKYLSDQFDLKRQFSCILTTNSSKVFTDKGGIRRFMMIDLNWIPKSDQLDNQWVKENCWQIWAEVIETINYEPALSSDEKIYLCDDNKKSTFTGDNYDRVSDFIDFLRQHSNYNNWFEDGIVPVKVVSEYIDSLDEHRNFYLEPNGGDMHLSKNTIASSCFGVHNSNTKIFNTVESIMYQLH